jgi:hypothetical protein
MGISENTSRRAVLAGIASAAALPVAAGISTTEPATADPIFEVIETHREARAASVAAMDEIGRLMDLADKIVGPSEIDIPSMVEPGTIVKASTWLDVELAIPKVEYPKEHKLYLTAVNRRREARFAVHGDNDPIGDEEFEAEFEALIAFKETVPTTLPGLRAMIVYAAECQERNREIFETDNCPLIANLALAAAALIGVQA